jgi:hypothetical protein
VPANLVEEITTSTQGNVTITTYTYSGATLIGTTSVNMLVSVPASIVPDFTTVTHSEATAGVAANVGAYVQNISTMALAITGAVGVSNSTITGYKIEVLNSVGTVLQTINASSGTTPSVINASGTITLRGTVTDSRGRTKVKTVTTSALAWAPPTINTITVQRALNTGVANEEGTYLRVNINAFVQSLINTTERNALVYRVSSRLRGTTTWTVNGTTTPGGIVFNGYALFSGFPVTSAYDVLVEVLDDFATSAMQLTLATSSVFMHWGNATAGEGLGIGKFWQRGSVDIRGDLYLEPNSALGQKGKVFGQAVNGGTSTERDAYYGVPANAGEQATLANIQPMWFNNYAGCGRWERYYAPKGLAGLTATGLVSGTTAGWYPVVGGPAISLVPSAQQSISSSMTFSNWAAPGTGASWRRGGSSFFTVTSGVITCVKAGRYSIDLNLWCQTGSGQGAAYMLRNNTAADPHILTHVIYTLSSTYATMGMMRAGDVEMNAGDTVRWYASSIGSAVFGGGGNNSNRSAGEFTVRYLSPLLVNN